MNELTAIMYIVHVHVLAHVLQWERLQFLDDSTYYVLHVTIMKLHPSIIAHLCTTLYIIKYMHYTVYI